MVSAGEVALLDKNIEGNQCSRLAAVGYRFSVVLCHKPTGETNADVLIWRGQSNSNKRCKVVLLALEREEDGREALERGELHWTHIFLVKLGVCYEKKVNTNR